MRHLPHRTLPWDSDVLQCCCVSGLESPTLPASCSMMMETLRDNGGNEVEERQYGVPQLGVLGQGYALESYRPIEPKRREQFVQRTLKDASDALSPAVAGIIESTSDDKAMLPFKVDTSTWGRVLVLARGLAF